METKSVFKPIVRNVITNDLYQYEGENIFKNIRTGVSGKVSDNAAQKTFKINLEVSELINEYPIVSEMINKLDLKYKEKNGISGMP